MVIQLYRVKFERADIDWNLKSWHRAALILTHYSYYGHSLISTLRVIGFISGSWCGNLRLRENNTMIRIKGHGSGCTTALSGMHRYLNRVYCLTLPTSMSSDNTQNLHNRLWNGYQNSARIQDGRSMSWQHTKHFDLSRDQNTCLATYKPWQR